MITRITTSISSDAQNMDVKKGQTKIHRRCSVDNIRRKVVFPKYVTDYLTPTDRQTKLIIRVDSLLTRITMSISCVVFPLLSSIIR